MSSREIEEICMPKAEVRAVFALLLPISFLLGCQEHGASDPRPHVIFITIDTLRADHLGAYGYPRETSPNLDRLAAGGIRFDRFYSQSTTTAPSHTAFLTSLYPQSSGVLNNSHTFPDVTSLMDVLRQEGYSTAGVVSSSVLGTAFGIQGEFDFFDDELNAPAEAVIPSERSAEDSLARAIRWIESRSDEGPLFLWVHLMDPHGPYRAPSEPDYFVGDRFYRAGEKMLEVISGMDSESLPPYLEIDGQRDAAYYVARYDAEIRYTDRALGAFFASLDAAGLFASSLVILTADHGEVMVEEGHKHYFSHGHIVYDEVSRVPLIVKEPARAPCSFRDLVPFEPFRAIDVAPSLLGCLGIEAPETFQGENLFGAGKRGNSPQSILSFGMYGDERIERQTGTQFSVLNGSWRYIVNTLDDSEELYDRASDPKEQTNLVSENPEIASSLKQELSEFFRTAPKGSSAPKSLSPEEIEKLRSLGYLGGTAPAVDE